MVQVFLSLNNFVSNKGSGKNYSDGVILPMRCSVKMSYFQINVRERHEHNNCNIIDLLSCYYNLNDIVFHLYFT